MSVAAQVELYVSKRPYVKKALAEGIVNYSALARKIAEEKNIESKEALKAALSRYQEHVSRKVKERNSRVEKVLEQTDLRLESGLSVTKTRAENSIVEAKTSNGQTSVVQGGEKSMLSFESPQSLERTPGVIEFILSSLAAKGINVDQFISCREDTHIVIDEEDAPEALETLQERMP